MFDEVWFYFIGGNFSLLSSRAIAGTLLAPMGY
jgi:hypothetical protein